MERRREETRRERCSATAPPPVSFDERWADGDAEPCKRGVGGEAPPHGVSVQQPMGHAWRAPTRRIRSARPDRWRQVQPANGTRTSHANCRIQRGFRSDFRAPEGRFSKNRSATAAVASVVDARIAVPVMCGRTRAGPASAARRRGADQARRQRRERHEQDHDREEPHHPSIVNARLGAMPPDGVGPPIHANWRTIFRATKSCAEATAHGRGTTAAVAPVTSSTFTNRPTRRRYVFASPSTKRPPSQTRCTTVTTSSAKRRWL